MINNNMYIKKSNPDKLIIASTKSSNSLARQVHKIYESEIEESPIFLGDIDKAFSDGEIRVRLEKSVNGARVFLIGNFFNKQIENSVNDNLISYLIALRAFREHGAKEIIAVMPYMPYARQDKPTEFKREPTTIKLLCDLLIESGVDRIVTLEAHCPQLHGFLGKIPLTNISSIPIFTDVFRDFVGKENVIAVSPDIGSAKLIKYFAQKLAANIVIASKHRPNSEKVEIMELVGQINENHDTAIILDDIVSTGGSIEAVCRELHEKGIKKIYVGTSHLLCVGDCEQKLKKIKEVYGLQKLFTTNSIAHKDILTNSGIVKIIDISEILALIINRLYFNKSISDVFLHG